MLHTVAFGIYISVEFKGWSMDVDYSFKINLFRRAETDSFVDWLM